MVASILDNNLQVVSVSKSCLNSTGTEDFDQSMDARLQPAHTFP